MSERDDELDKMLEPLMQENPSRAQVRRWQASAYIRKVDRFRLIELTAAACVGFLIGAWFFQHRQPKRDVASIFDSSATVESIYVKSN